MGTMASDADLYRRWRATQDETAFSTLARRHADLVFDVAWRTGGDRGLAEDALQEALLRLARDGTERPAEVGVRAWLARLALSKARNARTSEAARRRREHAVGARRGETTMDDLPAEPPAWVDRALTRLPGEDVAVLALRFLHGMTPTGLAQALDVTPGAARVRVHRALERLRAQAPRDDVVDDDALAALVAGLTPHTASAVVVEGALGAAFAATSTAAMAAAAGAGGSVPKLLLIAGLAAALVAGGLLLARPGAAPEETRDVTTAGNVPAESPLGETDTP